MAGGENCAPVPSRKWQAHCGLRRQGKDELERTHPHPRLLPPPLALGVGRRPRWYEGLHPEQATLEAARKDHTLSGGAWQVCLPTLDSEGMEILCYEKEMLDTKQVNGEPSTGRYVYGSVILIVSTLIWVL